MALSVPINSTVFTPISPKVPETSIPEDAQVAVLRISRSQWSNKGGLLQVQLWLSLDGGFTYIPGGGGTAEGGAITDSKGTPLTETFWKWALPDGKDRRAKLVLQATQEAVEVSGSLEFV